MKWIMQFLRRIWDKLPAEGDRCPVCDQFKSDCTCPCTCKICRPASIGKKPAA